MTSFTTPSQNTKKDNISNNNTPAKQEKSDLAQNEMANELRLILSPVLLLDSITEQWVHCDNGQIWQVIANIKAESLIEQKLEQVKPRYSESYLGSVIRLLKRRLIAPSWTNDKSLIPMLNGVFNIKQKILTAYGIHFFNWQLPFSYEKKAECPTINNWLKVATQNNKEVINFLMCYARAVITSRGDLQKYLEIIGYGGTGKGTYTRILISLIGESNVITTDLRALEKNRFETAGLYGKKLTIITDATLGRGSLYIKSHYWKRPDKV